MTCTPYGTAGCASSRVPSGRVESTPGGHDSLRVPGPPGEMLSEALTAGYLGRLTPRPGEVQSRVVPGNRFSLLLLSIGQVARLDQRRLLMRPGIPELSTQ